MKTIQSPDEVVLLMEDLWLRHTAGLQQRSNNVYVVEFPPSDKEEQGKARRKAKKNSQTEDEPEDNYGVWI